MPISIKHALNSKVLKDVLAKWSDGLYYNVKVLECKEDKRECLVLFEDDTKSWIKADDLHAQLIPELDEDLIACCICDDGSSKAPNQILICDFCDQGYHMQCHQPNPSEEDADGDKEWICSTCEGIGNAKKKEATAQPKPAKKRESTPKVQLKLKKRESPSKSKSEPVNMETTLNPQPKPELPPQSQPIKRESTPQPKPKAKKARVDTPAQVLVPPVAAAVTVPLSVEDMSPELIEAAEDVVQNGFGTKEFIGIVTEGRKQNVLPEVKPNKRSRKCNSRTAAA